MSSERSGSTSPRIREFGLYRNIDARTEEFLKLSRKRQIRQGCTCAAVSTAITVTVVVMILLVYEYGIAAGHHLVQKNYENFTNDSPIAERLDRSYFGFDQDFYERMPFLVNALQENNYVDSSVDTPVKSTKTGRFIENENNLYPTTVDYYSSIRRASPKPFIYEYRTPTPTPFIKAYNSKSWLDNYRNSQRLKNLQQLVKYLEKTINAKFGGMDAATKPDLTRVNSEPMTEKNQENLLDLQSQNSNNIERIKTSLNNDISDPLFGFKPEKPSDVNLLAESTSRFSVSPTSATTVKEKTTKTIMFRPIIYRKKHCIGTICDKYQNKSLLRNSVEFKSTESPLIKPKSFSVMLNLFPLKTTSDYGNHFTTEIPLSSSSPFQFKHTRPRVLFKKKITLSTRRNVSEFEKQRQSAERISSSESSRGYISAEKNFNEEDSKKEAKVFSHVNLFSNNNVSDIKDTQSAMKSYHDTKETSTRRYITDVPELKATQVEDYHVGSSGIVPIGYRSTEPSLPDVTPDSSIYETTIIPNTNNYPRSTNSPNVLKFSAEDAKMPDQYVTLRETENIGEVRGENSDINERELETRTLLIKLRNNVKSTTKTSAEKTTLSTQNITKPTAETNVPTVKGHSSNVNQNTKNINGWLNNKSEGNRRIRLQTSLSRFQSPYFEINRNYTRETSNDEE